MCGRQKLTSNQLLMCSRTTPVVQRLENKVEEAQGQYPTKMDLLLMGRAAKAPQPCHDGPKRKPSKRRRPCPEADLAQPA